ncbi:KilA-N domain-containing protein [Kerstersia gyiorum]|uniref:KilA-N domain-containing protein n=1 Tax=Kerstersia gyiorum TaxID=206506 RepID=UPI0039E7A9A8
MTSTPRKRRGKSRLLSNVIVAKAVESTQDVQERYSLNDLHRAAGEEPHHQPANRIRMQQTQELTAHIEAEAIPHFRGIESKQGLGTFVCKELVYAYAMWIMPGPSIWVSSTAKGCDFKLHPFSAGQASHQEPRRMAKNRPPDSGISRNRSRISNLTTAIINGFPEATLASELPPHPRLKRTSLRLPTQQVTRDYTVTHP